MSSIEEILGLLADRASRLYLGEAVSQREHALQAAHLAVMDSASDALVTAALLHDIGCIIGSDEASHETEGSDWLAHFFGPEVTEPVRLHVEAKRYLCTVDSAYQQLLSSASILSLARQGGLLEPQEIYRFERNRFHNDAMTLRNWDDHAKRPGLAVPCPEHYVSLLRRVLIVPET